MKINHVYKNKPDVNSLKTGFAAIKNNDSNYDSFEATIKKNTSYRSLIRPRRWLSIEKEKQFINNPSFEQYIDLAHSFSHKFKELGKNFFENIESILIQPKKLPTRDIKGLNTADRKLAKWHEKKEKKFKEKGQRYADQNNKRNKKINENGFGFSKASTKAIYCGKQFGREIKDYATLRGWMYRASDTVAGTSLYELLPRYGYRDGAYIGIRISEFALNTLILSMGYGLAPVTGGISKVVSDHLRTAVTIGGESLTHGILGAQKRKIITHASLRAVQLEIPKLMPGTGDLVQYAEMGMQSLGNGALAISYMADLLMRMMSTRYISLLTPRNLGDSSVLYELEVRIDYLSRFLIPYGQWLLLQESDEQKKYKLRKCLKKQSKILRTLEKKRINALNYYQLALLGGRIPKNYITKIALDTFRASHRPLKNCHRISRSCLATLASR
jgi:hypothetical protein